MVTIEVGDRQTFDRDWGQRPMLDDAAMNDDSSANDFDSDPRERASDRISDRKACAIASLVNGESVFEAAELAGVHRSTLYRWFQDAEFQKALERAKRDHCEMVQCELNALATVAIRTLCDVMKAYANGAELRVRVARDILKSAGIENPGAFFLRAQAEQGGNAATLASPFPLTGSRPLVMAASASEQESSPPLRRRRRRRRMPALPSTTVPVLYPVDEGVPSSPNNGSLCPDGL